MKNAIKFGAITLGTVLLAISCDMKVDIAEVPASPKMITVSCTIADSGTKISLTNDGSVGKTEWEATDKVLFHGLKMGAVDSYTYSYIATPATISADGKTASFVIPELDEPYDGVGDNYRSSLFAIYPASAVANYSNGAAWKYVQAFKETNHFLLVGYNDTDVDSGLSFTFKALTGAMSFKVSGDFDSYVVLGKNNEVVSYDKYSVTAAILYKEGSEEFRPYYTGSSGAGGSAGPQTSITVTPEGSDWCNGETVNTVFFPNGVDFTKGFIIKFFKSGSEIQRVGTKVRSTIGIGEYLDLGDVSGHLKTPPAHELAAWTEGAEDLSSNGAKSANCYYVYHKDVDGYSANAGKAFKFKAYEGNSNTSVGTIGGAVILWESYNNASSVESNTIIADVDYDTENGFMYFKMPESSKMQAGNAVIAATDALGTILWSWHIWVPDTKITKGTYGISTPEMMDRNLGALRAASATVADIQAAGLLYQWGRKDPFLNKKAYLSSDNDFKYHATESPISVNQTMSTTLFETVEASCESPTVIISNESGDWLATSDNTLWGGTKTEYDPCPYGYKVPVLSDCVMFSADITNTSVYTGWSYNTSYYNCTIGLSGNATVFPFGHLYGNARYNKVLERTMIWAATTSSSPGQSKMLYIYQDSGVGKIGQYGVVRANGNAIRCVVDSATLTE